MATASEEWKMYYSSNDIGDLDIKNQLYVAQRYFSLPVDEEFKKNNPAQEHIDRWYNNLKPFIEQAELTSEFLSSSCNKIGVLAGSSKKITTHLNLAINQCLEIAQLQIAKMNEVRYKYFTQLDEIVHNEKPLKTGAIEAFEQEGIECFKTCVTKLIPDVINKAMAILGTIKPESEIESIIIEELQSLIDSESTAQKAMIIELEKRNVTGVQVPKTSTNHHADVGIKKEKNEMTNKEIRAEYWRTVVEDIRKSVPEVFDSATIHYDRSAFDGVSRKGIPQLTCIARTEKPVQISVGVYFKNDDADLNKRLFDFLDKRKEEIRAKLPFKNVRIEPAEGKGRQPNGKRLHYNLLVTTDFSVLDEKNWGACRDFHCKVARVLYDYVIGELGPEMRKLG